MSLGIWQIAIVAVVILVLFGGKRLPSAMGDLARGIKEFKKGLSDEDKSEKADLKKVDKDQ